MQTLQYLDLSGNHLSGDLPKCLGDLTVAEVLDFSSNNLSGTIPSFFGLLSKLSSLHLSNNIFHGELSSDLQHSTSLSILDLGENRLSGSVPTWLGESLLSLRVLRLRSNKFNGSISQTLCHLNNLQILDVAHNNLSGIIPYCFDNFSAMVQTNGLERLDSRTLRGDIYTNQMAQVIKGRELEYYRTLYLLVNLDLSANNLVGEIPKEITSLAGLIGLNLSENHLIGNIPEKIGHMTSLKSLDFYTNNLSGEIPPSISSLSSLSHLNLSYNILSGPIPSGNQLQTLDDPSIYEGNLKLCGFPLEKKCFGDVPSQTPAYLDSNGKDDNIVFGVRWFYIGMAPGFVVGLWCVGVVLVFKKSWRYAYFGLVEDIYDGAIAVREKRLKHNQAED